MPNHRLWSAFLLYLALCCAVAQSFADEPPGSLDTSFRIGTGIDGYVHSIAVQPDGKILFGGTFDSYNNTTRHSLVRVLQFGSIDNSFNSPITDPLADVLSIALQTNAQIVLGLNSTNALMRLNSDGTMDTNFNVGSGPDRAVQAVVVQPDGKILIGGDFQHFNGTTRIRLARLQSNGTLDPSFDAGAGPDQPVTCIALQSDGRILIGGQFTHYRTTPLNRVARINSDGTLDQTFTPGVGADQIVYQIAIQPDGKLVIGGFFQSYDGNLQDAVARLNANGTYDASFTTLADLHDGTVFALELQRDGKVVVAGDMTSGHLVRLNTDGTKDLSYEPGGGPGDDVYAMAIQSDQKILIGGLFPAVDTNSVNHVARINSDLGLLNTGKTNSTFRTEIQTVSGKIYHLEYKNSLNDFSWTPIQGSITGDGTIKVLQDTNAPVTPRYYRAVGVSD